MILNRKQGLVVAFFSIWFGVLFFWRDHYVTPKTELFSRKRYLIERWHLVLVQLIAILCMKRC